MNQKKQTAGAKKAAALKAEAKRPAAKKQDTRRPDTKKPGARKPDARKPGVERPAANDAKQQSGAVRVSRIIDAPAASILRAVTDADRRGWAPVPVARVVSILAPRFVRLALPDGSQLAITITRQGNTRCGVQIEHMGLTGNRPVADIKREWMGALAGLAEQLDAEWD